LCAYVEERTRGKFVTSVITVYALEEGDAMTKLVIVAASILGFVGAAIAADLPTRQPPPPTPVVGKAPVGKGPVGKAPTPLITK